jgi:hypothetical protein
VKNEHAAGKTAAFVCSGVVLQAAGQLSVITPVTCDCLPAGYAGFMFLIPENAGDVFDILCTLAIIIYAIWVMNTFRKTFPIRASMFDLGRSSWPTTEAVVTRAVLAAQRQTSDLWFSRYPNPFYVWFEYEIGGVDCGPSFGNGSGGRNTDDPLQPAKTFRCASQGKPLA